MSFRNRGIASAAAIALAAWPTAAGANAGIGYLFPAIPILVVAVPAVILVEGAILARLLKTGLRRGLWLSFCANLASTLLGGVLAILVDGVLVSGTGSAGPAPSRGGMIAALVPMFFVSWWIEQWNVAKMERGRPESSGRSVRVPVLVANLVSYALLVGWVAFTVGPSQGWGGGRATVTEALSEGRAARTAVEQFHASRGKFPASLREAGLAESGGRATRSIRIEAEGRIAIEVAAPGWAELDRKRIVLAPRMQGAKIAGWSCFTNEVPHKYVPANCRRNEPEP